MTQSIGPPSLAQGTRIAVGFSTSISRFIPACGELGFYGGNAMKYIGSSPLARGTQPHCQRTRTPSRFIPAYAGNSVLVLVLAYPFHPRLRGELTENAESASLSGGSSPLTRGTHPPRLNKTLRERFIPAYAGNSISCQVAWMTSDGSSPLTRGTRLFPTPSVLVRQFIPAYAGNSCCFLCLMLKTPVHPRLRGELA